SVFAFLASVSYREQIATVPKFATFAVDHCTLLHAGKAESFCVSPDPDGAGTRSNLAPRETQGNRGIESPQHTTGWLPIPESIGGWLHWEKRPRMAPRMVARNVADECDHANRARYQALETHPRNALAPFYFLNAASQFTATVNG